MQILRFYGEYSFLSNFYEVPVMYDFLYGSSEAAYQAQKCANQKEFQKFTEYRPAQAKKIGRRIEVRPDWNEIKVLVMKDIVWAKFRQNPEIAQLLLETGDSEIIEGNRWHDTFWGVDLKTGEGENHLGKILMETRAKLRNLKN